MNRVIKYKLSSGEELLVEIHSNNIKENLGMRNVSVEDKANRLVDAAQKSLGRSLNCITSVGKIILEKVKESGPDKAEVEFGIKFNADANAIISSVGTEANFKIKMIWENLKD